MAGTQQLGGLCWGASGQVVDIAGSADGGGAVCGSLHEQQCVVK